MNVSYTARISSIATMLDKRGYPERRTISVRRRFEHTRPLANDKTMLTSFHPVAESKRSKLSFQFRESRHVDGK